MTKTELIDTLIGHEDFFLGGSRYFHKFAPLEIPVAEDTDWDFNVQFNLFSSSEYLELLGFTKLDLDSHPYKDISAYSLWHHKVHKGVSVIERINLRAYKTAFSSIDPHFYAKYMWKSNPKRTTPVDAMKVKNYIDAAYSLVK